MNSDLKALHVSFDNYKNPIVSEINKLKNENKSYEREVERYKHKILGSLYENPDQRLNKQQNNTLYPRITNRKSVSRMSLSKGKRTTL